MNREIKFRAWDKEKKKMWTGGIDLNYSDEGLVSVSLLNDEYKGDVRFLGLKRGQYPNAPTDPEEVILMQFTNLKDKNGKEIYEGDIVEFENGYWKVYFAEGVAQFRYERLTEDDFMDMSEGDECEVIGNIYENPELLK